MKVANQNTMKTKDKIGRHNGTNQATKISNFVVRASVFKRHKIE